MRLGLDAKLTAGQDNTYQLSRLYSDLARQLNGVSEGRVTATNNAAATVPTTGSYQVGDFVRNSAVAELGGAGNKYVLLGWICTVAPLTFVPCRVLTGN